jgi:molybdopterin/thiamine biosynthesis adenylyltransferase
MTLTPEQQTRYSRHIFLPEIGEEGQTRLLSAKVLIIGMGGLGSAAAYYLAASGVGTLYISDNELVELSNLQRQILYRTEDIGALKTHAAQKNLVALNPDITIIPLAGLSPNSVNNSECLSALEDADVVLDCTDNFPTRYAINALCAKLKKPLISGSAIANRGQVAVFPLHLPNSACYECLYPEQNIEDEHQPRCADSGVMSPLVGIIGSMQALETLLIINKKTKSSAKILRINAENLRNIILNIDLDPACLHHH